MYFSRALVVALKNCRDTSGKIAGQCAGILQRAYTITNSQDNPTFGALELPAGKHTLLVKRHGE